MTEQGDPHAINVRIGNFFNAEARGWGLAAFIAMSQLLAFELMFSDKLRSLFDFALTS
ncbi:MAG: hypothetical protein ABUS57_03075 [Pseudomonadota bacterium]